MSEQAFIEIVEEWCATLVERLSEQAQVAPAMPGEFNPLAQALADCHQFTKDAKVKFCIKDFIRVTDQALEAAMAFRDSLPEVRVRREADMALYRIQTAVSGVLREAVKTARPDADDDAIDLAVSFSVLRMSNEQLIGFVTPVAEVQL